MHLKHEAQPDKCRQMHTNQNYSENENRNVINVAKLIGRCKLGSTPPYYSH